MRINHKLEIKTKGTQRRFNRTHTHTHKHLIFLIFFIAHIIVIVCPSLIHSRYSIRTVFFVCRLVYFCWKIHCMYRYNWYVYLLYSMVIECDIRISWFTWKVNTNSANINLSHWLDKDDIWNVRWIRLAIKLYEIGWVNY